MSRTRPEELCDALALLRRCARVGTVDAETADRLSRRILARPSFRSGGETVEA